MYQGITIKSENLKNENYNWLTYMKNKLQS